MKRDHKELHFTKSGKKIWVGITDTDFDNAMEYWEHEIYTDTGTEKWTLYYWFEYIPKDKLLHMHFKLNDEQFDITKEDVEPEEFEKIEEEVTDKFVAEHKDANPLMKLLDDINNDIE